MAENVGEIRYDARIDTGKLRADAAAAEAIAKQTGDNIGKGIEDGTDRANAAFAKFSKLALTGMAVTGAAIAGGLLMATKSAGDYQSSLSQLAQASSATGDEMSQMSGLARQLGRDTDLAGVTAADAARTMVELSKAGLSVNDTMAATKGVMSLARAGNVDFADAAVIAASALNAFNLKGEEATQVADALAAGANASQAQLGDLAAGMQQSATVAKQFGLNLNETVTALALFANNGIKGSDAGTSLKTMLIALANPSKEAAKAMEDIGFKAYDAQGRFVGLDEMSRRLAKSTENLTDEQKQQTLATIFGTDAFRAAAVLAGSAGDAYSKMSGEVSKSGAAQKAAAANMGEFQRSTERAQNAISDLGLELGTRLMPYATQAQNAFADFITTITSGMPTAIAVVKELMPIIVGTSAAVATYVIAANTATVATTALAVAQGALNAVMALNPFMLLAGLAVGVAAAFWTMTQRTDESKSASERLKIAQDNLKLSTDALKTAQDNLAGAHLGVTGAELMVEQATNRYNEVLKTNSAESLAAREAAYNLEMAKYNLEGANKRVKDATAELTIKEGENTKNAAAVQTANDQKKASFERVNDSLIIQKSYINDVNDRLGALNGRTFSYTVEQRNVDTRIINDGVSSLAAKEAAAARRASGRAAGGPVSAGGLYAVGDNPDGSWNRTTELFAPRTPGTILSSRDLKDVLTKQADGGITIGTVNLPNVQNGNDFVRELKLATMGRG